MRGAMKGPRPNRFHRQPIRVDWLAVLSFCAGAVLIAVGLELFLKPNRLVTGGAQGISIMLSHMTEMQLGLFLFLINVPFLFLAVPRRGQNSAVVRLAALGVTAAVTLLLDPIPPLTEHPLAASVLGGLALGGGAGLILRIGGYTDGVNEAAHWVKRKVPLSVAELIMLFNLLVLAVAGFLFGWEQALYSVIAYYLAYRSLRYMIRGYHKYTLVRIHSPQSAAALCADMKEQLGPAVSFLQAKSAPSASREAGGDLLAVIAKKDEGRFREALHAIDPAAVVNMMPFDSPEQSEYKYLH
ncbi:YitT family protein [Paenibacillus sp. GYB004]|uniref:YitT family protein n=1 Tax=Paenibacillus sp. GYB004 TaxID=2994393 RepID=UPI002F96B5EC